MFTLKSTNPPCIVTFESTNPKFLPTRVRVTVKVNIRVSIRVKIRLKLTVRVPARFSTCP